MSPEERQKLAYDLKQTGRTWREIGNDLGKVSPCRAKALAKAYEAKKRRIENAETEWEKRLAMNSGNLDIVGYLREAGFNSPEKIINAGAKELLKVNKL